MVYIFAAFIYVLLYFCCYFVARYLKQQIEQQIMGNSKEPVRLRQRKTPSGLISLYLDIYVDGRRSYEYLKMYLVPEKTRADKEKNKQTLLLADAIRAKRVVELRNGKYGFNDGKKANVRFFDYYESLCEKRLGADSKGNWGNWYSCLHHLRKYEKRESITFEDITPNWVNGFRNYLDKEAVAWTHDYRKRLKDRPLAQNSKVSYFNKLRGTNYTDESFTRNRGLQD